MADKVYIPGAPDQPEPQWVREAKSKVANPEAEGREHPGSPNPMAIQLASCLLRGHRILEEAHLGVEERLEALTEFHASVRKKTADLNIRDVDVQASLNSISRTEKISKELWDQVVTDTIKVAEVMSR